MSPPWLETSSCFVIVCALCVNTDFLEMLCYFADWLGPTLGPYPVQCPYFFDITSLAPQFDVSVQAGISITGTTVNVHLGTSELGCLLLFRG